MSSRLPRRRALQRLLTITIGIAPLAGRTQTPAPTSSTTRPRLRYGGDADFEPFEWLDPQGRPQGLQPELLAAMSEVGGFDVEITLGEWAEIERGLDEGRFDAIAMVQTPAREAHARFLQSHATTLLGLFLRQDRRDPQSLGALQDWKLATPRSEPMDATRLMLANSGQRIAFELVDDAESALQAVQDGRVDGALVAHAYADRLLQRGEFASLRAAELQLPLQAYAFALAPGLDPAWTSRLQDAMDRLESDGRLEQLRRRWLSSHRRRRLADDVQVGADRDRDRLMLAGGAATLLALGAGGLAWRHRRLASREAARRRLAEAETSTLRQRLEQSFLRHPDAMLVVALESGRIVDANPALGELLGQPCEALRGTMLGDLPGLADATNLAGLSAMVDRDGGFEAVPLALQHPITGLRHCLASCQRMPGGDEPTVFALVRDITEQIEENRALREGYQALTKRLRDLDAQLGDARARGERIAQQTGELLRTSNQVLRSGLRNVRGLVGLVQQEVDAGRVDRARQSTGLIDQAASRMEAVLDGLAGLASVDSQPLERRPVDMRRCVRLALETAARGHPGLSVATSMADDLPATQADAMQMVMLWRQLVDNAYQFSAGSLQPKLRIDAHRPDGRTWWRITDNGRGIDPTRAERLFRPFQRLHAAPDADSQGPGLGLGLALVQRIVERHEGEVRARSNPGVGTVIEFCLEPRRGAA